MKRNLLKQLGKTKTWTAMSPAGTLHILRNAPNSNKALCGIACDSPFQYYIGDTVKASWSVCEKCEASFMAYAEAEETPPLPKRKRVPVQMLVGTGGDEEIKETMGWVLDGCPELAAVPVKNGRFNIIHVPTKLFLFRAELKLQDALEVIQVMADPGWASMTEDNVNKVMNQNTKLRQKVVAGRERIFGH